jgi:predicted O-methyltransferase YrrM
MDLNEQYERLCLNTLSDIYEFLPVFTTTALAYENPCIIELGVRAGVSTIAWLNAVNKHGGYLYSVDGAAPCLDDDGTDLLGEYMFGEVTKASALHYWTFLQGWDNEDWVQACLPFECDILFIDTNHTYEMTTDELETYYPRVRPDGRILLHDTNIETTGNASTPQPPYPVRTAVEDFCARENLRYHFNDSRCGLGVIYV